MDTLEEQRQYETSHKITVSDRAQMRISGVTDVMTFDEQTVRAETVCGTLTVTGCGLHIEELQLETGDLQLNGKIDGVVYTDRERRRSLAGRLFR